MSAMTAQVFFPSATGDEAGNAPGVAAVIRQATGRLEQALGLERGEARLEAQILVARALGVNRAWLVAHDQDTLTPGQADAIEAFIARREQGEPVAYILGEKEFHGRLFQVSPAVLIPRPETELLVQAALERLPREGPARILDLGTGSGCIAITLALERPDCALVAVDASPAALGLAEANARRLGATRCRCLASDWYAGLDATPFDMILANPPYIAAADPHLEQGDLRHEPRSALASGVAGLDDIARIVVRAPAHLAAGGWLLFEHGYDQGPAAREHLCRAGFSRAFTLADWAGHPRVSGGQWRPADA